MATFRIDVNLSDSEFDTLIDYTEWLQSNFPGPTTKNIRPVQVLEWLATREIRTLAKLKIRRNNHGEV